MAMRKPGREHRLGPAGVTVLFALVMLVSQLWAPFGAQAFDPLSPPEVTADSIYVFDATLDTVLYEKNADERRSPASLTKIATALVVLEQVPDLSETVVIDPADVLDPNDGQSMVGLVAGDVLTVEQLLYGLLINSGNDAANTLARHIGQKLLSAAGTTGDPIQRFVQEMNTLASKLGATNTNFANTHGLYHPEHLTTARDLGVLTKAALSNPLVATIVSTSEITITSLAAVPVSYTLQTTNKLLGQNGISGVKTGTLSESGACLIVSLQSPADTLVISVVLGSDIAFTEDGFQNPESDRRYDDTLTLLSAMRSDYTWLSPGADGALPGLAQAMDVWDVTLASDSPVVLRTSQVQNLRYLLRLGPPVEAESEAGSLLLYDGDELIAERALVQLDSAA